MSARPLKTSASPVSPSGKSRSKSPLRGVRVLVGRARHQAGSLSSLLRDLGARVVEIPFIEIRQPRSYQPLDRALRKLAGYDWLILTSVNGVNSLFARSTKLRISSHAFSHLKIAAIGPATRQAIEARGMRVDVVPTEYVAESVVTSLGRKVAGKKVVLVRARVARDVIPRELRALGAQVDIVEAYETVVPSGSKLRLRALFLDKTRRPNYITFTSSSTVHNFARLLGARQANRLAGIRMASIGPVTSNTLRQQHLNVDVEARSFTIPGLVEAIVSDAKHSQKTNQ